MFSFTASTPNQRIRSSKSPTAVVAAAEIAAAAAAIAAVAVVAAVAAASIDGAALGFLVVFSVGSFVLAVLAVPRTSSH